MASKVVHLTVPPIGAMAKLTLPARDDEGMQGLAEATKELGSVRVQSALTALEWYVQLYNTENGSPHESHLYHFVRMVEHHLDATCTFSCAGKPVSQEEWVAIVMKPVNEKRGD